MLFVFFLVLFAFFLALFFYANYRLWADGEYVYLLVFLLFFLPLITTFQSVAFNAIGATGFVKAWSYLKELAVLSMVAHYCLTLRSPLRQSWHLLSTDILMMLFVLLAFAFLCLPIGAASLGSKVVSFKNILIPAFMYFVGRGIRFTDKDLKILLYSIMVLVALGFLINILESASGIHLQKLIGYARFQYIVRETPPKGFYGLGWNFENGPTTPRFAGYYANTVESGATSIMVFAMAFYWFWHTKYRDNQIVFALLMFFAWYANYVSGSRAAFAGFLMCLFIIGITLRYYRILLMIGGAMLLLSIWVVFLAPDRIRYDVIDTLTFEEASSAGHLIEWIEGIDSMSSNPLGAGLGMSGTGSDEEDDLKIGGENQYIIYGVQLGILGLMLYVLILADAIRRCIVVYRLRDGPFEGFFPFVAAVTKFGILFILFTSNIEIALFLSYFSWFAVGVGLQPSGGFGTRLSGIEST